jgi:hypothetical protein
MAHSRMCFVAWFLLAAHAMSLQARLLAEDEAALAAVKPKTKAAKSKPALAPWEVSAYAKISHNRRMSHRAFV